MKIKNLFTILLTVILLIGTLIVPISAKGSTNNDNLVDIIIYDEVSNETKEKIEKHFITGEPVTNDGTTTYGLTCTLLGHKLESTTVDVITHKVRSSAPRCVCKTYDYEACTRCDYETSELVRTEYIYCCA